MIIIMIIIIIIMIIIIIIIIIIITITITITITIVSLKFGKFFRNSASYSLIVTFTRRKNIGVSAAATTYLTPLIWREDPGQSYPEETKDKHRGSSTRKPLCMVLGLVASQPTRFSEITGEGKSSKINSSQHSFNTPFFILHLINNNFLED